MIQHKLQFDFLTTPIIKQSTLPKNTIAASLPSSNSSTPPNISNEAVIIGGSAAALYYGGKMLLDYLGSGSSSSSTSSNPPQSNSSTGFTIRMKGSWEYSVYDKYYKRRFDILKDGKEIRLGKSGFITYKYNKYEYYEITVGGDLGGNHYYHYRPKTKEISESSMGVSYSRYTEASSLEDTIQKCLDHRISWYRD